MIDWPTEIFKKTNRDYKPHADTDYSMLYRVTSTGKDDYFQSDYVNIYVFESGKSAHGDWEFRTHEDVNETPFHVPIQEPYLSRYYKHGDQYANILMGRVQILASKFGALSGDETKWAIEVAKRLSE